MDTSRLAKYTLAFLLLVIAWGAFVRASGSGAGCGSHWPLCNGQILPLSASSKTLIEFTHRVTSGISLILCFALGWSTFRNYPRGSFSRKAGAATVILIVLEALLGAGLVLLELVAENKSAMRAFSLGIHLINTFLLIAAVLLVSVWSKLESRSKMKALSWKSNPGLFCLSGFAVFGILLLGSSGAMTALGDTLFPASHFAEGLRQDFSPTSHFLIQLRILHPTFAVLITSYMVFFCWYLRKGLGKNLEKIAYFSTLLAAAQLAQVFLGGINIFLLAPTAVQLGHLLLADIVWLLLIQTLALVWVRVD